MVEKEEIPEPDQQDAGVEQPQAVPESTGSNEGNKDARMWGMFCHLASFAGIVVPVIGCVVGPLVVWQIKKEEFPFVNHHGKEAVNFQISILIYAIVSGILCLRISEQGNKNFSSLCFLNTSTKSLMFCLPKKIFLFLYTTYFCK